MIESSPETRARAQVLLRVRAQEWELLLQERVELAALDLAGCWGLLLPKQWVEPPKGDFELAPKHLLFAAQYQGPCWFNATEVMARFDSTRDSYFNLLTI